MSMKRLVDPVHFFNSEGASFMTMSHLMKRNEELEDEVQRLTKLLRSLIVKDKLRKADTEVQKLNS